MNLYAQRCAQCHHPLETSNLKELHVSNIVRALEKGHLPQGLSDREIQSISLVLSGAFEPGNGLPLPEPPIANELPFKILPKAISLQRPLGTRTFVASVLSNVFLSNSSREEEAPIAQIIRKNILERPNALGGSCTRFENQCPADRESAKGYAFATQRPTLTPSRIEAVKRACEEIVVLDIGVKNVLGKLPPFNLSLESPLSVAAVENLFRLFFPYEEPPEGVRRHFTQLLGQLNAQSMQPIDRWRLVILPICESLAGAGL